MRKICVVLMILSLLLVCACGKQTADTPVEQLPAEQPPVQPERVQTPEVEVPEQNVVEAAPQTPTAPEAGPPTTPEISEESVFAGKVAVLLDDAALQNASVETVDAEGNVIVMDMALALKKGALVYVEAQKDGLCDVILLAGEPPHPRGQLQADQLSAQPEYLLQAAQVILKDTPIYAAAGDAAPLGNRSGVAAVELRNALWWKVALPGGGEGFWIRQTDLTWEWPLPEVAEEPESTSEQEPEGAVASVMLPGKAIPGIEQVEMVLPLEGNVLVLQAVCDEQTKLLLYDMAAAVVLEEHDVSTYGSVQQPPLSILETASRTFLYFDGRDYWKFTADGHWQLEKQAYDLVKESSIMGEHEVEQRMIGIAVDGTVPDGLKSSPTEMRSLIRILDDHRLLYEYLGASAHDRHVGIYDHDTGETHIVSSMGQRAWGIWDDTLILVRGGGPVYDLVRVDLEDYSHTPLEIGHETVTDRVDAAMCNVDGTRLMVSWEDHSGTHVEVFDVETGEELYRWSTSQSGTWSFWPVDHNGLVACCGFEGGRLLWKVEY